MTIYTHTESQEDYVKIKLDGERVTILECELLQFIEKYKKLLRDFRIKEK